MQAIKHRMRDSSDQTLDTALDAERDAQGALGALSDYREAVQAFTSKRSPKFA
jgi:2-(1,2-epoxy-1,2-dihydrophenyl)acetyl-CoA isomerase